MDASKTPFLGANHLQFVLGFRVIHSTAIIVSSLLMGLSSLQVPDYDDLEPLAQKWPAPPAGCHVYHGRLTEVARLPIVGKESATFTFVGYLVDGLWTDVEWTLVEKEQGVNFLDVTLFEDNEPMLPLLFGESPDKRQLTLSNESEEGSESTIPPEPIHREHVQEEVEAVSDVDESPLESLSWLERMALKAAIKRGMEAERESFEELGLDLEVLTEAINAAIDSGDLDDLDIDQFIEEALQKQVEEGGLSADELEGVATLFGEGMSQSYEAEITQVEEGSEGVKKGPLEEVLPTGDEPEVVEGEAEEYVEVEGAKGTGGDPEDSEAFDMDEIFEIFDSDVEMQSVHPITYQGKAAFQSQRILDVDKPMFGEPRLTGRFVTFDAETLQPKYYFAEIAHPTRLKEAKIAAKIKALKVELELDDAGQVERESLFLSMRFGPFFIKLDHRLDYQYQGPCKGEGGV